MIAGSQFGGPIAMIRDDKKVLLLQKQQPIKPTVYMYTSAGKLIEQIQWEKGRIIALGWTKHEELVIVTEDGFVRLYPLHGSYTQFSLGKEAKEQGILDCQIWSTGLVAMTNKYKLIAVTDFYEPRPKLMADTGLDDKPHSWTVIPPQYTLSRHVEVLIATGSTIIVVDNKESVDQRLQQGPFTKMAISPNGKFLALFTSDGKLWVVSTDFQKNLSEYATKSKIAPQQLVWCGTDSVVLYWDKIVLMVGPFGDWIKFSYEGPIFLISEVDGVRIMSADKCEMLQRVPAATEEIFKIGSTSPAALLFDALDHFERKSPKADENIRNIKADLVDAVDCCIEAAGFEFHHYYQRSLLKAASFGKCFLENYNADRFVEMAQSLRVLNAVRDYHIGIPLTYAQFKRLTPDAVIDILIRRNHHLLAVRIADYLKVRSDKILVHWACAKIKASNEDEESICRTIVDKLYKKPGLSYAEIAKTAYNSGQSRLATKLIDHEPRAADQVPLLISMQEDELALMKAIESGDTDLVYLVIFQLKRKLPLGEFFRVINNKPLACSLLEVYCKEQDKELLKDFYYQDDRRIDSANTILSEGFEHQEVASRISELKVAAKTYQDDKECAFEAKATDEAVKLLHMQTQLEKDTHQPFIGLSVSETIYKCTMLGQQSKSSKVKSEFKVPDKRYWWIKLRALVEVRDWENLEKLAKTKNSPIGYEPFVEECIKAKQYQEASKYILKCDTSVRPMLFVKIGAFKEASEQAFLNKDTEGLKQVRAKCNNHIVAQEIDSLLAQLNAK
ncbi:vacuolar protein sorting vps16 [Lichtheimia corymbifera JMRC:FSU:9682]|uniref:Probable vacuolar protein sorting-associated protein 16 homolog n=1 Tax=Lichtheimia corymbifera JMRC:FSU:9682 TaxID=1263082 RepID=A0A068SDL8_9FUNG|nr:vacuolar protein sorting vps16 [Lichtheimia corymbifera JMRC:FSU:9682]